MSRRWSRPVAPAPALAVLTLLCLATALPARERPAPIPVSPGGREHAVTEDRCPTFSWAGVPGAAGYELAIFRVADESAPQEENEPARDTEPELVARISLPANTPSWTPAVDQCLERGHRYAWSIAVTEPDTTAEPQWAEPALFQVQAAPSIDEVERAVATLNRYLATERRQLDERRPRPRRQPGLDGTNQPRDSGALTVPTAGIRAAFATPPPLGPASLSVSGQIHLGATSSIFQDNKLLMWNDPITENTALGANALSSDFFGFSQNTAVGTGALRGTITPYATSFPGVYRNTAIGARSLFKNYYGRNNTASGALALYENLNGFGNTANGSGALGQNDNGDQNTGIGTAAMVSNTSGSWNTAVGSQALFKSVSGYHNTAAGALSLHNSIGSNNVSLGFKAGYNSSTGNFNIFIANQGTASDDGLIKIGTEGTQGKTFLAGIRGKTTGQADAIQVLIDSNGQLGTVSSSRRLKQDIQDLGSYADRLLALHPVAFRFEQHAAADPDTPLQFGLIAEEVAEVFPELVVTDGQGRPAAVKYHLLSALLLGELQREHAAIEELREELAASLAASESRSGHAGKRHRRRRSKGS